MASPTDGNRDRGAAASVPPPPLQFGLRSIFVITAIAAALAAGVTVGGADGFLVAIMGINFLGWMGALAAGRPEVARYVRPMFWVALIVFLWSVIMPRVSSPRPTPHRVTCANNMRQIAESLLDFDLANGHLPPAFSTDVNGKPLCSWRSLILPYLGREDMFAVYHPDEPWDGPNNKVLSQVQFDKYRCPGDTNLLPNETSYVAIIGPGTIWSAKNGTKLSDVTDGGKNTILFVEMRNSGIKWAEPRDLDLNHLPPGITKQNLLKSLSNHSGRINVVFADAHVDFIPDTIPWADFEAILTIAGGEKVDRSKW
jgi:prepilin-type processing-associated H-X9-DG protein